MRGVFSAPERVNIYFTHRCNLSCGFCYYREFQSAEKHDLPIEEWLNFLDELAELRVFNIGIFGGEPFLRRDLAILIDRIVKNRMRFTLISNGTVVNDDIAEKLAADGRCDGVQISIDGLEETHDSVRGVGSWKRAFHGIETLHRAGVKVSVNSTIGAFNAEESLNLAQYLNNCVEIHSFRLNLLRNWNLQLPESLGELRENDIASLILRFESESENLKKMQRSSSPIALLKELREPNAGALGKARKCGNLNKALTVRADGVIIPCPSDCTDELGKINIDSFAEIWLNSPILNSLRLKTSEGRFCLPVGCPADCEYAWYCRQYCPVSDGCRICRKKLKSLLPERVFK